MLSNMIVSRAAFLTIVGHLLLSPLGLDAGKPTPNTCAANTKSCGANKVNCISFREWFQLCEQSNIILWSLCSALQWWLVLLAVGLLWHGWCLLWSMVSNKLLNLRVAVMSWCSRLCLYPAWSCQSGCPGGPTPATSSPVTPAPTAPTNNPPTNNPPSSCPAVSAACGPGNPCAEGLCCSQWGVSENLIWGLKYIFFNDWDT